MCFGEVDRPTSAAESGDHEEAFDKLDLKAKKYLRRDGANLEVLKDKKLKGQLVFREKLYSQSANVAAKTEKKKSTRPPNKSRSRDDPSHEKDMDEIDAFHKQRDVIPLDVNGGDAAYDSGDDIEMPVFDFEGRNGRPFLFSHAMNIVLGSKEDRELITELHTVADVFCRDCRQVLGWKYVRAYKETQKYKEGKFILEKSKIAKEIW